MSQTRITIRPLRHTDASDIYELMHMPNVLWGTSLLPSTPIDSWYKTVENWVYDERMHVFVTDVQGKVAGIINMRAGTGRESHVGDIDMAVHDKYQGQGIGKMLLLTVIDLADNWLNLVRLEVDVYTDNEPAIHVYKHFDFEIEGCTGPVTEPVSRDDQARNRRLFETLASGKCNCRNLVTAGAGCCLFHC